MRTDIDEKKDWIVEQLILGISQRSIARDLNCKVETLRSRLTKWDLVHVKNQSGKGQPKYNRRVHVSEYLGLDKKIIASHKLKLNLWRDGYKEKKCEQCSIIEWQEKPAPLELDHINGDNWDNRLENLRILCANCHAQTSTNSGKNRGKRRK